MLPRMELFHVRGWPNPLDCFLLTHFVWSLRLWSDINSKSTKK